MTSLPRSMPGFAQQRGIVLLMSLAYLLAIAIIAGVIVEAASLQFRMAGNHEARTVAEQGARAVAHELTASVDHWLQLPPTHMICGVADRRADCDESTLAPPRLLDELGREHAVYGIRRRYPRVLRGVAGREPETRVSSAAQDRFALYEIDVSVVAQPGLPATARAVRGVAVRLPSEPQQ